jgi:hypothetical protein
MEEKVSATGAELAQQYFPHLHVRKSLRLNNGSFGACPTEVLEAIEYQRRRWIEAPDYNWYHELEQVRSL